MVFGYGIECEERAVVPSHHPNNPTGTPSQSYVTMCRNTRGHTDPHWAGYDDNRVRWQTQVRVSYPDGRTESPAARFLCPHLLDSMIPGSDFLDRCEHPLGHEGVHTTSRGETWTALYGDPTRYRRYAALDYSTGVGMPLPFPSVADFDYTPIPAEVAAQLRHHLATHYGDLGIGKKRRPPRTRLERKSRRMHTA
jgi:hypothetical protein